MVEYHRDLGDEVEQQMARALRPSDDTARVMARRLAIDREEKLRLAELGKKRQWRVQLRLTNLLEIRQPKLQLEATVRLAAPPAAPRALPHQAEAVQPLARTVPLVWDPLLEAREAPDCPGCQQPTSAARLPRSSNSRRCPACGAQGPCRSATPASGATWQRNRHEHRVLLPFRRRVPGQRRARRRHGSRCTEDCVRPLGPGDGRDRR
jgi:hypothetical protein